MHRKTIPNYFLYIKWIIISHLSSDYFNRKAVWMSEGTALTVSHRGHLMWKKQNKACSDTILPFRNRNDRTESDKAFGR